jgi:hypothetical protein
MNATITQRVAAGAALLDEKLPGWDKDIDLGRLDLGSPCRCILGQLHYDADRPARSFDAGLGSLGLFPHTTAVKLGFNASLPQPYAEDAEDVEDPEDAEFAALTGEWRRLILGRREAGRP